MVDKIQIRELDPAASVSDSDLLILAQGAVDRNATIGMVTGKVTSSVTGLKTVYTLTGSVNSYNLATPASLSTLTAPLLFLVKVNLTNTNNCTLQVDSCTPVQILDDDANQISPGSFKAGGIYLLSYDGSAFQAVGISNYATAADILVGTDATKVVTPFALSAANLNPALNTPIGTVVDYAGATAPGGWLLCNGQAVSRVTYSSLFSVLGTTFGAGDGVTTFNVPNCTDRVVVGAGGDRSRGATFGADTATSSSSGVHSHTATAGGAHTHTTDSQGAHSHTTDAQGNHSHTNSTVANHSHTTSVEGSHAHGGSTDTAGGHSHSIGAFGTVPASGVFGLVVADTISSGAGDHSHGLSTDTTGDHGHSISAEGGHTHSMTITGEHTHTVTSGGAHTHTATSAGSHSHTIEDSVAHTHTVSTVQRGIALNKIIKT